MLKRLAIIVALGYATIGIFFQAIGAVTPLIADTHVERNYNPIKTLNDMGRNDVPLEPFLGSPNEAYTRAIVAKLDRDKKDRRTLAAAGWIGTAAEISLPNKPVGNHRCISPLALRQGHGHPAVVDKMKPRISKRTVDALVCPPDKDRVILWDGAIPGFGVVAFPTGVKVYIVQYRAAGKSHRHKIGRHGHLTPSQARVEAQKLLGQIASGKNPAANRKAARDVRTFESVASEFVKLHLRAKKKPRSAAEFQRIFDHDVFPAIGQMRVTDVMRRDISRLHSAMSATPVLANKILIVLSAVWNWAGRQGEVDAAKNPATGIERYREQRRERILSADELGRIGDELARAAREHPWPVATIRLLALTGMRVNEVLTARWDYLDIERAMFHLADSKTGRKSIVLNAAALEVLAGLPRIGPYVILGQKPNKPRTPPQSFWRNILKAAKVENVRLHDLRHNFATVGAGAQMGLPLIGKLLGHTQPATTARYAHLADNPLRAAAETIGAQIDAALNRRNPADVVELKPKREI